MPSGDHKSNTDAHKGGEIALHEGIISGGLSIDIPNVTQIIPCVMERVATRRHNDIAIGKITQANGAIHLHLGADDVGH